MQKLHILPVVAAVRLQLHGQARKEITFRHRHFRHLTAKYASKEITLPVVAPDLVAEAPFGPAFDQQRIGLGAMRSLPVSDNM